jgi:hypothetical protein
MRTIFGGIISGLFIFIYTASFSQNTVGTEKKKSFHKQLKATTTVQINQLKDGALFVRLKTNENVLAALKKSGNTAQIAAVEKKQAEINHTIIAAFREQFNFSPVYFFYSNYSTAIKNKDFNHVIFLNDSLQPDTTIKFKKQHLFIADFGVVEQDTARYLENQPLEADGNFSVKRTNTYYGGPSFGYEGLIIRSDAFVQLRHPFPYFIRTHDAALKKKVVNTVVKKMNKKLHKFYRKRNTKKLD